MDLCASLMSSTANTNTIPSMITVNTNTDRFFIAIAKLREHSFILLGVYEEYKVKYLLSRVGKMLDGDHDTGLCKIMSQLLFTRASSRLDDEGISQKKQRVTPINYHAYDITYEQYLEFINILSFLSIHKNQFTYYRPISSFGKEITLALGPASMTKPSVNERLKKVKDSMEHLNIHNTCRHSAITLVEEVRQAPVSSMVSSYFFKELPYQTALEYGKPVETIPFYVLPVPPIAYLNLIDERRQKIITELYQHMEQMLLIEPNSQKTKNKFACLKNLYNQMLAPEKNLSLHVLLLSIQQWKDDNLEILACLRKQYIWDSKYLFFTRTSATMKWFNRTESELKYALSVY